MIEIEILNKIAKLVEPFTGVCGNSDYVIHFTFDEEWNEFNTKTARFKWNNTYQDVVFTGNDCPMPVVSDSYKVEIGVFAGDLHTTTPVYILMKQSILSGSGVPAPPSEDVYSQIMEMLNTIDGVTPEQVAAAVSDYLTENPVEVSETDPTVPSWAKQANKPSYTAEEVGAEAAGTAENAVNAHDVSNTAHADIRNELAGKQPAGNYITNETDPTVPSWAKQPVKPAYTASEVGAESSGAVATHNQAADAHADIRNELNNKINASELATVATTGAFSDLDGTPTIPTKTSDLTNDSGYLTQESDPTVPSWAKQANKPSYTASEVGAEASGAVAAHNAAADAHSDIRTALAAKANTSSLATVATSGSYNDLSNKPTIVTVWSGTQDQFNAMTEAQKNANTFNAIIG